MMPTTAAPRATGRLRRALAWLVIAVLVVIVAVVSWAVVAETPARYKTFDPSSPNSRGTLALAEVLRAQGVDVTITRTRAETAAALTPGSTLAMADPFTLTDDAVRDLIAPADRVVFLTASSRLLRILDLGEDAPGSVGAVEPGCDLPQFAAVGTIRPGRLFSATPYVTSCFGDEHAAALLFDERSQRAVIDGSALFSNQYLADDGNAALALALLAQTDKLVWYVPSFQDSDVTGETVDSIGSLTPKWLTPVILLLILSAVVAGIWRGQRFGPLVAENLPVTVRASETMHGRARLTSKAADSPHAAAALRAGAHTRLSKKLRLSARASAAEIADAASDRLQIPRGTLYELLGGGLPQNDLDLTEFARQLSELESAIDAKNFTTRSDQ